MSKIVVAANIQAQLTQLRGSQLVGHEIGLVIVDMGGRLVRSAFGYRTHEVENFVQ